MKEEIKARLERALALDQTNRDEQETIRSQTEAKTKSVEAEWSRYVGAELLPSLGPITQIMTEKGWTFHVTTPANELHISVYKGNMKAPGGLVGRPNLKFDLNARDGTVSVFQATQQQIPVATRLPRSRPTFYMRES